MMLGIPVNRGGGNNYEGGYSRSLRVQETNNHILTPNLCYNYYYPKPKYLIIGYLGPLGSLEMTQIKLGLPLKASQWRALKIRSLL